MDDEAYKLRYDITSPVNSGPGASEKYALNGNSSCTRGFRVKDLGFEFRFYASSCDRNSVPENPRRTSSKSALVGLPQILASGHSQSGMIFMQTH